MDDELSFPLLLLLALTLTCFLQVHLTRFFRIISMQWMLLRKLSPRRIQFFSAVGGSSGDSIHSGLTPSSTDDNLTVLQMEVARLGLDNSPAQPAQSNFFFRQPSAGSNFAMLPCKDFVAEFSNSLIGSSTPKRQSKTTRTLASMADADSIGVGRAPEIEQPVAALVVSPDEACEAMCIAQYSVRSHRLVTQNSI